MMKQYLRLKAQAGDALLLFRMGDFYELFLDDAELAAPLLDLVLTTRDKNADDPVPMCGIPYHAAEGYVKRLLEAGRAVAIAEQVEDPRSAKGLVRREIVEVVSPGLVANPDRLGGGQANYIAAVLSDGARWGLAYLDLSTAEFAASEAESRAVVEAELDRLRPRELVERDAEKDLASALARFDSSRDGNAMVSQARTMSLGQEQMTHPEDFVVDRAEWKDKVIKLHNVA